MEGFATGFAVEGATLPGFSAENEEFRITFKGVICDESRNLISEGFESCYDWRPVMDLILQSTLEEWEVPVNIEETAEGKLKEWLTTFQGWGLLSSLLPATTHRFFILSLAFTCANWDEDSGGVFTEEKAFHAVKTVYETVPGKELASIVPKFGVWFEENVLVDKGAERRKNLALFFKAKWVLEVKFVVEKKRVNRNLLELAAESVVSRLMWPQDVERLEIPEVILPTLRDKLKDADWVRSYWIFREHLEAPATNEEFDDSRLLGQHGWAELGEVEVGGKAGGSELGCEVEKDKVNECESGKGEVEVMEAGGRDGDVGRVGQSAGKPDQDEVQENICIETFQVDEKLQSSVVCEKATTKENAVLPVMAVTNIYDQGFLFLWWVLPIILVVLAYTWRV